MAKLGFVVFGVICSFAFTNSYVVTVPDDELSSKNGLYEAIEDFTKPIKKINREESRPKDEFEIIEPVDYLGTPKEVPEFQPYPTFVEDIPYHSVPAVPDIPEEGYANPFYIPDLRSHLSGFDELMWNDKDFSLGDDSKTDRFLESDDSFPSIVDKPSPQYFHPIYKSEESLPSIVNGMESSLLPRLQDDVLEDAWGSILVKIWMLEYCSIHPECSIDRLEAELAKMK